MVIYVKRMKIRKCEKNENKKNGKKNCSIKNHLITDLGTILAGFQQGPAKTNPYAYHPVLTH
jgi:hypothetical protein